MPRDLVTVPSPVAEHLLVKTEPRPGEGLAGAVLWADRENRFDAGTVLAMSSRHETGTAVAADRYPGFQYLGTSLDLPLLAAILRWTLDAVRALTLLDPLRRIYGPDVSARSMGRPGPLAICPRCVGEQHLLLRSHGFNGVTVCPVHGCLLVIRCNCGAPLRLFGTDQDPFTCWRGACQTPWQDLPVEEAPAPLALEQQRYVQTLEGILEFGDARLFEAVRYAAKERRWTLPSGGEFDVRERPWPRTLSGIAARLAELDIRPDRVRLYQDEGPTSRGICADRECEYFGRGTRMRGLNAGAFRYCTHCGSRSIDGRLVSSFNVGHGAAGIPPEKVQAARADWARWWLALDQTSRDLAAGRRRNDGRMTVRDVFDQAHVPTSPNLRATRLGLVWLVRHNLGKSITIPPGWPAAVAPNARWNHPIDVSQYDRADAGAGDPRRQFRRPVPRRRWWRR